MVSLVKYNMNNQDVLNKFADGIDCGQVIVEEIAKDLNLDVKQALKAAAAFGGGMYEGEMCGSYIGGLIAVGLKYGHCEPGDGIAKGQLVSKVFEYKEKYKELQKSNICSDILGYNLTIPEEAKIIEEKQLMTTVCPKLVIDIINIVKEL
ncbi:C-GCAxxG-C-C family protein [Peptostreptococcus faecalis]|uniref:C-GCAxxG-C-C family protein n=1 Tax=Peptostreptococcus faecalis TaxID=2045015 RepID=UPI001FA8A2C0|nr:C-GCAxxG-C-C family protein [Peptostreptococcus faecalis]